MSFSYEPTTGDTGVGTIEISSEAEFSVSVFFDKLFSWQVGGKITKDLFSSWDVGDGEYSWYRIEGECRQINCENINVQYDNCNSMTFVTVVAARNLPEVCEILKSPRLNAPVNTKVTSIQKYSRPVLKTNIVDDECNILQEQYFCQIPECEDYCLDYEGKVSIGFESKVIEALYSFSSTGGIVLLGRANTNNYFQAELDSSFVFVSGSCLSSLIFNFDSVNSHVTLSGSAKRTSSHYSYLAQGKIETSGSAACVCAFRKYRSNGSVYLAGTGFSFPIVTFNDIGISGQANVLLSKVFGGNGELSLSGGLYSHKSSSYTYLARGGVATSTSAQFNFRFLGTMVSHSSIFVRCLDIQSDFNGIEDGPELTIQNSVVNPSCGCGPIGLSLLARHNLSNSTVFANFLRRNGMSDDGFVDLKFKSRENAWHGIKHMRGLSHDGSSVENWTIIFIMACNVDFWRFSFAANTQNELHQEKFQTKFIIDIPSDLICYDNNISTNIRLDIRSGEYSVRRGVQIPASTRQQTRPTYEFARRIDVSVDGIFNDYVVYYDNLGLFKNSYWSNVPFEIDINPRLKEQMSTFETQSIFR